MNITRRQLKDPVNPLWIGVVTCLVAVSASAQTFSIDWFTIDGGGGTSTGSVFEVGGTIGQPDAGARSGGAFTLTGGFWSVIAAIQTPDAPELFVERTSTNTVRVFWAAPATDWSLRQNPDLKTTSWSPVSTRPTEVGGFMEIILSPPDGNCFYRLIQLPP